MAAAEGNFDFQEIASFLPVPLFFFSANQQKVNFPSMKREMRKKKKREKKKMNEEKETSPVPYPSQSRHHR